MEAIVQTGLLRFGSTKVKLVGWSVGQENLRKLATLLEGGDVRVVIPERHPLADAPKAVPHMLGHHAIGKIAITG